MDIFNRKGKLEKVIYELLQPNNRVTTLEVKNRLREKYPLLPWNQDWVSANMASNSTLKIFDDNGSYRTYGSIKMEKRRMTSNTIYSPTILPLDQFISYLETKSGTVYKHLVIYREMSDHYRIRHDGGKKYARINKNNILKYRM